MIRYRLMRTAKRCLHQVSRLRRAAGSILPMWSNWEIHRSEQEFVASRKKEISF
jgi:hypothetical protein